MAEPINRTGPPHDIISLFEFDGVVGTSRPDAPGVFSAMFWKFFDGGDAYFAEIPKRRADITIEEVKSSLQRIPDDEIYPKVPANLDLTVAPTTGIPKAELFIKRPALAEYDDPDHDWIRGIFLAEAQIMEQIAKTPHENIVQYYGCCLGDGYLKEIVLERHRCTLLQHFQCGGGDLDTEAFMAKLESAVHHLHSLGLAHNDLKPSNIMLNTDNMPVLIDFGSCQPFGMRLMSGGTPGWFEEPSSTSAKEQDIVGLKLMRKWLADPDRKLLS